MTIYALHGAQIQVTSLSRDFLDFVSWNLLSRFPKHQNIDFKLDCELSSYDTVLKKRYFALPPKSLSYDSKLLLSTGLWLQKDNLYWTSSRANISFEQKNINSFQVQAQYRERPDHSVRRWLLRQKTYLYNNYQIILRLSLYAPLFYLFEQYKGYFVMHAAGVSGNKRNIILSGLNGIGKTTLALAFAARGYRFLGDNYLLYDANTVYAFPESIRVSSKIAQDFGLTSSPNVKLYGKYIIRANSLNLLAEMNPNIFLIVVRGPTGKIDSISLEKALELMFAQGEYLAEYPEYTFMGLNIFANTVQRSQLQSTSRPERKLATTRQMLSKCKLGLLQIGEDEPTENTIIRIENF